MKNTGRKPKTSFKEKMMYYFDLWLSRGTVSTILLLFCATGLFILMIGILAMLIGGQGDTLGKSLWDTMNHAFDPGVLSGDSGNKIYEARKILFLYKLTPG